jgi:hypothetical protein
MPCINRKKLFKVEIVEELFDIYHLPGVAKWFGNYREEAIG